MSNKKGTIIILAIAIVLAIILLVDMWMMFGQTRQQTKDACLYQLETVSGELEGTISAAERETMEFAIASEKYLGDKKALKKYVYKKQKELAGSGTDAFNVYVAGSDWFIIPDFNASEDYDHTDRSWYTGAMRSDGKVYVTSPYKDAGTGNMCYSVSVMLSDGETVLAVDYTLDTIQKYITRMHAVGGSEAVIVAEDGTIAGCFNEKLVGQQLLTALPQYAGIWSLSKNSDNVVSSRIKSNILYNNLAAIKSGNGWYLIVSVGDWALYHDAYLQLIISILLVVALFITVILVYFHTRRSRRRAEADNEAADKKGKTSLWKREKRSMNKRYRNWIMIFMALVMLFSLYTNISATYRWGTAQMKSEADHYEYKLSEWVDTQKSILDMFVSTIATNPEMLEDYEGTVDYLNRMTEQYPEISVSYLANPKLEHTVYMNTGWEPGPEIRIEERPWYMATEASKSGWSITAPYFDAQTGAYCVTMSKKVVDAKTGKFLGIFGIDFFMDDLVTILGDSYSDKGYAFLVDTEGIIVNHPYGKYQMSEENQASVLELPYNKVKANGKDTQLIRDYDGSLKILLATVSDTSKFSIYVVYDAWAIYGRVIVYGIVCLIAFLLCMAMVYRLLSNMIAWQDEVNRRLQKAAQTDAMTGLLNKSSSEDAFTKAVKQGSGTLLIVDLDNFKLVNDLYSHDMGDRILIRFSELLREVVRDNDIVGRIGGDEFAVYCESLTDEDVIVKKAAFLNDEIVKSARDYMGSDMKIPIGCSVGAVRVPQGGREYSVLFFKADLALHRAKQDGKHGIRIYHDNEEKTSEENSGGLASLRTLFGERSQKKSALVADQDMFRDIYRFMVRFSSVCPWNPYLVVFTFESDETEDLSEYTEQFIEMSSNLLRSCDVILKYNAKQVLVLLMETNEEKYTIPVDRLMKAWEENGSPRIRISHQQERLDSER